MADNDGNKISSLPPATVMSGTEEFVFAKGGGNGKVSFSDLLSNIPAATTEAAGLMSSLDKEKVITLSTGTLGTNVKIGEETKIGTGVRIDNMVQIKSFIDGNNKKVLILGTDKYASGVSIEKIGEFGVKIGSATLGGNTGGECYIGSGVFVGDNTFIGNECFIGDNASIDGNVAISRANGYTFGAVTRLGEGADIGKNVEISTNTSINRKHGIYVEDASIKIGEGVRISPGVLLDESGISTPAVNIRGSLPDKATTIEDNVQIGAGACLGDGAGMDSGIYISATSDGKLHIGGDAGQDVYLGRPSYLGVGARVEDSVRIDTSVVYTNGYIQVGNRISIGAGLDIEKDGDDICFMKRMPDYADIILKSGSYLGGAIYDQTEIGTGVVIKKTDGNNFSIGSSYLGDNSYLGESSKMWRDVEIGTAVKIVGVNITGYGDRVVISNGEGKTITLNWDN